ncbi:MAG: glycoside hydrolase family 2 protein, partial [Solirubrobacteraceae bacterium]
MPRVLIFVFAIAVALALPTAARAADPPAPVALAQNWQFAPDPGDRGLAAGWQKGRGDAGWESAIVPHVLDPDPSAKAFEGTVGWYRFEFEGPEKAAGAGWWLRFEQVRRSARVWLNGREIGSHRDPYVPFELPATGLRAGETNTLVVRADNRRVPGTREGWWNWGGITRPVSLVARGPVVLHDVGVVPRKRCDGSDCRWEAIVDGWLENHSSRAQQPSVGLTLRSPDGDVSTGGKRARMLRGGERVRVRYTVKVDGEPLLWSPEKPRLYNATVRTSIAGTVTQSDKRRIGLRTVSVSDGALRLNGRVLDLHGASIQEDVPGRGPALTDADVESTVEELKALGANVTRAHYLLDERLLRRFDEEGILVWSQAP